MSSPYGYAPQPQQPSNNGAPVPSPAPSPAPAPAPAPPAGGYSQEQISGPVNFHVIGQNENGKAYFDETYQG